MIAAGWTKQEMAIRVAQELPVGSYVNLGVGLPVAVAAAVTPEQHVIFHCENGLIGYRALEDGEPRDADVIDALSEPVGLIVGASVVAHDLSFAIARGGRLDATVLGAFQVSRTGDLANWKSPAATIAGVGGAMDLAVGAKQVIVMMKHLDRAGQAKIVEYCDYPLTAVGVVGLIVTDLAVIRVTGEGLLVEEIAPGVSFDDLQSVTATPLLPQPTYV